MGIEFICIFGAFCLCGVMFWMAISMWKTRRKQGNIFHDTRGYSKPLRDMVIMDMIMRGNEFFESNDPLDEITAHMVFHDLVKEQEFNSQNEEDYYQEEFAQQIDEDQYWDDQANYYYDEYTPY